MTTVYGVTYVGARDQIERQLREKADIPAEERWNISSYVAKQVSTAISFALIILKSHSCKTLAAIGDLFNGAKAIQNWLNITAKLIAKSIPQERLQEAVGFPDHNSPRGRLPNLPSHNRVGKEQMTSVIWTTALGLPIVQPYRKTKRRQVRSRTFMI